MKVVVQVVQRPSPWGWARRGVGPGQVRHSGQSRQAGQRSSPGAMPGTPQPARSTSSARRVRASVTVRAAGAVDDRSGVEETGGSSSGTSSRWCGPATVAGGGEAWAARRRAAMIAPTLVRTGVGGGAAGDDVAQPGAGPAGLQHHGHDPALIGQRLTGQQQLGASGCEFEQQLDPWMHLIGRRHGRGVGRRRRRRRAVGRGRCRVRPARPRGNPRRWHCGRRDGGIRSSACWSSY